MLLFICCHLFTIHKLVTLLYKKAFRRTICAFHMIVKKHDMSKPTQSDAHSSIQVSITVFYSIALPFSQEILHIEQQARDFKWIFSNIVMKNVHSLALKKVSFFPRKDRITYYKKDCRTEEKAHLFLNIILYALLHLLVVFHNSIFDIHFRERIRKLHVSFKSYITTYSMKSDASYKYRYSCTFLMVTCASKNIIKYLRQLTSNFYNFRTKYSEMI